jgi:hypothetical protein
VRLLTRKFRIEEERLEPEAVFAGVEVVEINNQETPKTEMSNGERG